MHLKEVYCYNCMQLEDTPAARVVPNVIIVIAELSENTNLASFGNF